MREITERRSSPNVLRTIFPNEMDKGASAHRPRSALVQHQGRSNVRQLVEPQMKRTANTSPINVEQSDLGLSRRRGAIADRMAKSD